MNLKELMLHVNSVVRKEEKKNIYGSNLMACRSGQNSVFHKQKCKTKISHQLLLSCFQDKSN